MSLSSNAVFITCFLLLTSPGVRAGSVTMKLLWSSQNSTYVNITFADTDFQELYICMGMDSTIACIIHVHVIYPEDGNVTSIQRRQADDNSTRDVNSTRENYFICTYMPTDMHVVCNRQDAAECTLNIPRTSFRLDDPCCHNSCVWLLWSDAQEQLLYGNNTIEICESNCTPPVTIPVTLPTARLLNETTLGHEPANRVTKDAGISEYDHGPSLIVSVVVASIIVVNIIIVIACVLYKRCHGRGRSGNIKITKKKTTNTESFRTLAVDLTGLYVNTDQTRLYSSLEFLDGAESDQHVYVKMDDAYNSQSNTEEYNKQIYENTELCKPNEATNNHTNSSDITNKKQRNEDIDRTHLTIGDSYAIMEDLRDESEVNRSIMTEFTTENTYVDLEDEATGEIYIKGDTEMDSSSQCSDSNTSDTNIYANTEVCVPGEAKSPNVHKEAQSSNIHREAQSSSGHREAQSSSGHREAQSSSVEEDNVYTSVTPREITTSLE